MTEVSVKKKSLFALDDEEEIENPTCNLSDSGIAAHETSPPVNMNNKSCESNDADDDGIQIVDKTTHTEEATSSTSNSKELTGFQKAKIERNRQRALLLRQARLQAHPYKKFCLTFIIFKSTKSNLLFIALSSDSSAEHSVIRVQNSRLIDSGGGFLIDEQDLQREQEKEVCSTLTC